LKHELNEINGRHAEELERKHLVVLDVLRAMETEEASKHAAVQEVQQLRAANLEANQVPIQ
jgi:phosphoribosyl 1,2-cyclic phosphodiesterase